MKFCEYEDLIAQVPAETLLQQADMEAPPGESDERDNITPAILNATAEIEGYLRRRYALPEVPEETPATLRKYAVDIAIYHIFSRKGLALAKEQGDAIIAKRYDDAIAYLKLIVERKVDVAGLQTVDEAGEEGGDGSGGASIPLYRS
jgi:phage gp36-like protein